MPVASLVTEHFIKPRSIAVIGASEGPGYGARLLRNLREHGFKGAIYPVNPHHATVQGLRAWADVSEIPEAADLAVAVVPPPALANVIESCARRGIRACAIITAGFAERGPEGEQAQRRLLELAQKGGVRFTGPNTLGVANVKDQIFATATSSTSWDRPNLRPSGISVVSQSGALAFNPIPSRAAERGIALRAIVSLGNQVDLTVSDFVEYFVEADEDTRAVALFLEGLPKNEGSRFLQVARRARELNKPILVVKVGRSPGGAVVARSHTAALTGDDAVYQGAFRAVHVTRVDDLDELWETGALLAAYSNFMPSGGIGFLSNSGGMNSLFSDQCGAYGVRLAKLETPTVEAIKVILSDFGAAGNPADVTGNISRPTLVDLIDLFTADPGVDLMVVGTTGSAKGERSLGIARHVETAREHTAKPVVGLWPSALADATPETSGAAALAADGIPVFAEASKCARALGALYAYRRPLSPPAPAVDLPAEVSSRNWAETQQDALCLLRACGIPTSVLYTPDGEDEAAAMADRIGYPVVLKIEAPGLRHKTEHGGVRVGIRGSAALRQEWGSLWNDTAALGSKRRILLQKQGSGLELLLGSRVDPTFGPVIALGAGGTTVEIERDLAFRPAPLDSTAVSDMLRFLRVGRRFAGARGVPARDVEGLVSTVVRFSALAATLAKSGTEIEINPLMLLSEGEGVCAVDARLTLDAAQVV